MPGLKLSLQRKRRICTELSRLDIRCSPGEGGPSPLPGVPRTRAAMIQSLDSDRPIRMKLLEETAVP